LRFVRDEHFSRSLYALSLVADAMNFDRSYPGIFIFQDALLPGVTRSLAALTTITVLQIDGYSLMPL
jgi:hypothetical protein